MNNNDALWKVSRKWGGLNAIFPVISTLTMTFIGMESLGTWLPLSINIIVNFILTPVLLYKCYRNFEQETKEIISAKSAWAIAGIFILINFIIGLLGQLTLHFSGKLDEMYSYMDTTTIVWAFLVSLLVQVILYAIYVTFFAQWWMREKAEQPGWAVFVPIYNLVSMTEIAKKPGFWVLLLFIPLVGIAFAIMLINGVSKSFGKDEGFTAGMIFLPFIFYPLIGFGKEPRWIHGKQEEDDFIEDDIIEHLIE